MKFTKRFSFILCAAALFLAGTLVFARETSDETLNDKVNRILKSEEYKNSRKPSAVAREMPKQASAPTETPVEATQGYQEPRAFRSSLNLSESESNKLSNWLKYIREINGISYTPEYIKQFNDEIDAKYDKPLTEEEKKIAPVLKVSTTVASIAGRGFYYEASGKDVDDIPTYELNAVLEEIRRTFGYTAEDFIREGFDDPYDAAREYIKSATGIVRRLERQQKEFLKLPDDEQQEQMREIYGDRWFSSEEVKQHAETMSIRGATELAFMNGAEAKTVSTAIMMALSEIHDEDMHRSRLAQMSPEQARKAEKLWKAIRPE